MRRTGRGVGTVAGIAVIFSLVGALVAEERKGSRVIIYPGDYVVQSGDVRSDGTWREGVEPSRLMVFPGETVVQAGDVDTLGRWRIDVDPFSGQATATAVTDRISARRFEDEAELKAEVSPHLDISLIDCTNCNGTTATFPRTIRVEGIFDPVPPSTPAATWENPAIGWPSSPSSSANVVNVVLPGTFFPPPGGPYAASDFFAFEFDVQLDPVSTFSVYVDVLGDLVEP